ncbi:MAG TPA: heme ABC transporter permease, partial [Halieaceae bacterium]|nr:heme ABC transporter permease [Halieaceae bacterium]
MWRIVHQFGSPPWVYRFCDRVIPWLLPLTVVALLVGSA